MVTTSSAAWLAFAIFIVAVTGGLRDAAADLLVRLKDGRILTIPVEQDQIESIQFGKGATRGQQSPAERAARQMRQDGEDVRSSAAAAARAAVAADRAVEAANAASRAAEEARKAQEDASRAARAAEHSARRPPQPSARPAPSPLANQLAGPGTKARTLTVGSDGQFALPSAAAREARDGDVIEIRAGTYTGDVAVWTANNLVIRGVGGRVLLEAADKAAEGKAIWVIKGNNTTVQNITFSGCRVSDLNGAGIRLEGTGLVVRHSSFASNEVGLMTGANPNSDVLIEHSEFARNRIDYERYAREGRKVPTGINPGHNIYIGKIRSFTLRFSYVHGAAYGHDVKSRAARNTIAYNRIGDEADGRSSYAIDLANGGWTLIVGNVLHQGVNTDNSTIVSYGAEAPGTQPLYVVNNTFVNDRGAGIFVRRAGTGPTQLINNILAGGGTPLQGSGTLRNNLIVGKAGLVSKLFGGGKHRPGSGELAGNLVADSVGFVAPETYDYRLGPRSPAVDAGVEPGTADGVSLVPAAQYSHPLMSEPRATVGRIDIGAYEFKD